MIIEEIERAHRRRENKKSGGRVCGAAQEHFKKVYPNISFIRTSVNNWKQKI